MPTKGWIQAILAMVAGAMILLSALTGDSIDQDGLRWLSGIGGFISLLVLGFDRRFWRLPVVRRICEISGHPMIHGTWRGTLNFEDDGEGHPGEMIFFMAIRQTFSSVSVRCYFPTTMAESWSLAAALRKNDHRHDLIYVYQQRAPAPARAQNRPTEGACELAVSGRPVRRLEGSYYSERGGAGTITLTEHTIAVAGSLGDAEDLNFK